jgi:hypothetical protein
MIKRLTSEVCAEAQVCEWLRRGAYLAPSVESLAVDSGFSSTEPGW